jgi:hypothetical protein
LYKNDYELIEMEKDQEGRFLILVLRNQDMKLIVSNAYFPNDHKLAITFAEALYLKILEYQHKYPDYLTIAAGDYNVCMKPEDSLNRNITKVETYLADSILNNNKITNLVDSYRNLHKVGGFTWKRGTCYSRLDYIFLSSSMLPSLKNVKQDWSFEESDHAAVQATLTETNITNKGPGIAKVNINILDNPIIVSQLEKDIQNMLEQMDNTWSPHDKLEFLKVVIRSVFSAKVAETRKSINLEIGELEDELNDFNALKLSILDEINVLSQDNPEGIEVVDNAITSLKCRLLQKRNNLSTYLAFRSKVKWFEYGEKPNKFFLNLTKSKQSQKLITKISNNGKIAVGQEEVTKEITNFYKNLYKASPRENIVDDNFYDNCPKLSAEQAETLDKDLTLLELSKALNSSKDSAPGPDGIPYQVYKKFWKIAGPIILDSWIYSIKTKTMPPSHYESMITLLPKDGKDPTDIKNWRPITLSNCDAKIITKALANKTSKVLESIIDKAQTAYVPGRSVADNLRSNFFLKTYCKQNNIDSVLVSLDAKKAFDSVDHRYIEETLRAYGFGEGFIGTFKLLYKNITARILVNGFQSESINIERGVKQGDALSCAIFIICIDPLIRNINNSNKIIGINIKKRNITVRFKGGAYADDVSVICRSEESSVQGVFDEYNRLTKRSGLELNAEKTEILRLNNVNLASYNFTYNNQMITIKSISRLKICGLYYSVDCDDEYELNVRDKIKKLKYKIKLWTPRHLTMEGKILIVKTFGLSQLIYNMQCYEFKEEEIRNTERSIFDFIWSNNESQKGIDRISRAIMKNEYEFGGMKVTDVDCLDRSLKLKQFTRAQKSKHEIAKIQEMLTGDSEIRQEYCKITTDEKICQSAQGTINIITDYNRNKYCEISKEELESDRILIDEVSSINLKTYLERKKRIFLLCILKPVSEIGVTTLGELIQSFEHEQNQNLNKAMKLILSSFPNSLLDIAKCYNEEINNHSQPLKYIVVSPSKRKPIEEVTTKEMQILLKLAMKKVEKMDFHKKLGINFDPRNIITFRTNCKNAKLRNIYFRLIHRDFFTYSRMKRFKMTESDKCPRCGITENINHLLWECAHVKLIWDEFNNLMTEKGYLRELVSNYEDIYSSGLKPSTSLIKIRLIQVLIQMERPKAWNRERMKALVDDLIKLESHIARKNFEIDKFNERWKFMYPIN